ncbi:transcriptional regulator, AsnC family [Aureimonas phyllosphaerae]|uniref:Lrp/AsnC family transcriptional regulator n=2 Tax=Aurantimonadaceae TaxID=255475 RepID=A0A7W6BQM4_9HYPH|nr:Lrp/AsnC family transcriptional regulator [Aureimonas phyllosphaerae]MBB3959984.1 Lrp/AsnC family transcriptional regulator [Aureimonas phyllosphaerae]SFF47776.1 transcriptional regulator, AsnC family [Aureimonas phyllosphaerae]
MHEIDVSRILLAHSVRTAHTLPMLDDRDRLLLDLLQDDADRPVQELAERASLSASACSRRIQRLRDEGYLKRRIALVDRKRINLPTTVFVIVKTSRHSGTWLDEFRAALAAIPEIVEVHRLTGNFDYILKVVLPDVETYDTIYKRLVARVELFDVSAYISMETVKADVALPTRYA